MEIDAFAKGESNVNAEEFRIARAKLNLSYSEIARHLGVSRVTASRWARGASPIPRMAKLVIEQMLKEKKSEGGAVNAGEVLAD